MKFEKIKHRKIFLILRKIFFTRMPSWILKIYYMIRFYIFQKFDLWILEENDDNFTTKWNNCPGGTNSDNQVIIYLKKKRINLRKRKYKINEYSFVWQEVDENDNNIFDEISSKKVKS